MSKKTKKTLIILGALVLLYILFQASTYSVEEGETAVIRRFGKMDRVVVNREDTDAVQKGLDTRDLNITVHTVKGLNFRLPFVEEVQKFSSKSMTYISETATINTYDRRRIDLSMFAQYRVVNPALFSLTIGTLPGANALMDDRVYPAIIQTANTLQFNEFFDREGVAAALESDVDSLNDVLVSSFGVQIVDIGIYRKNFPQANIESIEQKMIQEIQKESEKLIAEGDSLLRQSKAETDRVRKETLAEAVETAADTKAEADAEAIRIFEEAIRADVEFYRFVNRMESFREMQDTTVFLDPSNDFIGYLSGVPSAAAPAGEE